MTWQQVRISDLGQVVTGDTPPKSKPEYYGSAYPFIKPTDMEIGHRYTYNFEDGYSEEAFERYRKKLIPAGATAVVTIGTIGQKLTLTHTPCFVNQAVNAIIPDPLRFDSMYVYYLLRHNLHLVKSADTGASSGRENVSKSNFSGLEVLATLDKGEQQRIAKILDGYDCLIENNHRRIQLLEEAARRLYREWFVALRFPGHERVKVVEGVPKGWKHRTLGDVCDATGGATPTTARADFWDGDITWLTPTDVTRNKCLFLTDSSRKITSAGLESCSSQLMPAGTIFMTSRASIGYFAMLDHAACTNQGFISVVPTAMHSREFLLFHLMSRVEEFISRSTGSTFLELSKKTFRAMECVWPSDDVLDRYSCQVGPMLKQIEVLKKQLDAAKTARDALLPRLMWGALAV